MSAGALGGIHVEGLSVSVFSRIGRQAESEWRCVCLFLQKVWERKKDYFQPFLPTRVLISGEGFAVSTHYRWGAGPPWDYSRSWVTNRTDLPVEPLGYREVPLWLTSSTPIARRYGITLGCEHAVGSQDSQEAYGADCCELRTWMKAGTRAWKSKLFLANDSGCNLLSRGPGVSWSS
jgi:hypothetical protein